MADNIVNAHEYYYEQGSGDFAYATCKCGTVGEYYVEADQWHAEHVKETNNGNA